MLKLYLFLITLMAILSVLRMCQAHGFNMGQIETLKKLFLPAEYRNTNFIMNDLRRVFTEKCKKAADTDNSTLSKQVEKEALKFGKCISDIINLTSLQKEIDIARPIGELDTVFHKYCEKATVADKCFKEFNTAIQPCLNQNEKTQNAIMMRTFSGLLRFMCARGGDKIVLFIAEEGPECFEANNEAIIHCANDSFNEFAPKNASIADLFKLPDFVIEPEHCIDLMKFETCTIHHLEQCREITPANVTESVFKFIKNETNCRTWLENKATERPVLKDSKNSSASLVHLSGLLFLMGSFISIFSKWFI